MRTCQLLRLNCYPNVSTASPSQLACLYDTGLCAIVFDFWISSVHRANKLVTHGGAVTCPGPCRICVLWLLKAGDIGSTNHNDSLSDIRTCKSEGFMYSTFIFG